MVIYDKEWTGGMIEFGIEIPIMASRAAKAFEFLSTHPDLGPLIGRWYISKIDEPISKEDLLRVHASEYVDRLYSDELEQEIIRTFELVDERGNYYRYNPDKAKIPLARLFDRTLATVAGTTQCCRRALKDQFCFSFRGGMHHGHRDFGHGFCMLNDIVVAIRKLQAEEAIRTAWVIDTDAHKGDGTAALTEGDDSITTLSIHMGKGWPLDIEKSDAAGNLHPSFIDSDIDIPMFPGEDQLYITRLRQGLDQLGGFPKPDLALVLAGVDAFELDELPSTADLKLNLEQLMQRDQLVYRFLKERKIPSAFVAAGGYGGNSWKAYAQFLEWALLDRLELTGG
ncbi:MAG: histone deacetylase [Desulfobacterales bacterium]|nr:histone deacetylase [Desulfobacterales bacterium]